MWRLSENSREREFDYKREAYESMPVRLISRANAVNAAKRSHRFSAHQLKTTCKGGFFWYVALFFFYVMFGLDPDIQV